MAGTKRKHETEGANGSLKKRALSDDEAKLSFRDGLFDREALESYTASYTESQPYKHGVIQDLMQSSLLRSVRDEVRENLHFTPKETDIYKIHQSGDLANLDGLDDSSLSRLPSLLKLRDALYSSAFRKYIADVAQSGPLSGQKTDMAINVYTPGCHLLCHDDVIGSRRVSYILYLTDPDIPWKPEWGGALRLYPVSETVGRSNGEHTSVMTKRSCPDHTVSIPPAFNQLAFFAVQPGESFHDVEEVYHRYPGDDKNDGGRVRMAISGWYHIPQEGEEGYEEGLEERLAEKSSLTQLQVRDAQEDEPRHKKYAFLPSNSDCIPADGHHDDDDEALTEEDLEVLIKFLTPNYLTPDTVEDLAARFEEDSSIQLSNILSDTFAKRLRLEVARLDQPDWDEVDSWPTARPPYKHRFKYIPETPPNPRYRSNGTAVSDLFELLASVSFKKWLSLATGGLEITTHHIMARCFRRGRDYTLATSYDEEQPRLEICIGMTPTKGWSYEEEEAEEAVDSGTTTSKATETDKYPPDNVGGSEVYMAGEDDEPDMKTKLSNTGAGQRRKADPAIYRAAGDDEDDGVLFSMPVCWNRMSIVLRDAGTLKFVKYVSRSAPGNRFDVCGEYDITGLDDEESDEDDGADGE